ncbi:MAG TPA: hypothetical protein ENN21_09700 [Spirochaetes bacterium]|nr:hypothetical protein [Spirochaetota bacterium]
MNIIPKTIEKLLNGTSVTIAALGDSLTQGWMVRRGYLDFLEELIREKYPAARFSILNRGIPGDTAHGGLVRVRYDVIEQNPDLVFIQFALNDAFTGYTPKEFGNSISEIIEEIASSSDAEIVLITSVCLGNSREDSYVNQYYGQLEKTATEKRLPLVKVHKYWKRKIAEGVEFRKLVQADMVHPTVLGYQLMAEAIMQIF